MHIPTIPSFSAEKHQRKLSAVCPRHVEATPGDAPAPCLGTD